MPQVTMTTEQQENWYEYLVLCAMYNTSLLFNTGSQFDAGDDQIGKFLRTRMSVLSDLRRRDMRQNLWKEWEQ
jgi:hypothetical protein